MNKPPIGARINWGNPISKGLVSCYLLNEGTGTVHDIVYGLDGSLTSPAVWNVNNGEQAIYFGSTGYLGITHNGHHDTPTALSVFCRCKVDAYPTNYAYLIDKWTYTPGNYRLWSLDYQQSAGILRWRVSPDGLDPSAYIVSYATSLIPLNVYNNFIGTYDGTTRIMRSFLNGVQQAGGSFAPTSIPNSSQKLYIGGGDQGTAFTISATPSYGRISLAMVWNRALTPNEVMQLQINPFVVLEDNHFPLIDTVSSTPTEYVYVGALNINVIPNSTYVYQSVTGYTGSIVITLTPNSVYSYHELFIYSGGITTNITPVSLDVFVKVFIGNLNITFTPTANTAYLAVWSYTGSQTVVLTPTASYVFQQASQYVYIGHLPISLLSSASVVIINSYVGSASVIITPLSSNILDKVYTGSLSAIFNISSSYILITVSGYNGNLSLSLTPHSTDIFDRVYIGNLNIVFDVHSNYSGIGIFRYTGVLNIVLSPLGLDAFYRIYNGDLSIIFSNQATSSYHELWAYDGHLDTLFNLQSQILRDFGYAGDANITLVPDSVIDVIWVYSGDVAVDFIPVSVYSLKLGKIPTEVYIVRSIAKDTVGMRSIIKDTVQMRTTIKDIKITKTKNY